MLEEKIYKDYIEALKAKDKHKTVFLSFMRAELKNSALALKKDKLEDNEVLAVFKKQKKHLEETKETISSSGRVDAISEVERELSLLDEYLPVSLSDSELTVIIDQVITEIGATSVKDMGRVMKQVMATAGARADAKKVSDLVRKKLVPA
ncbi:MAG: GatB/YqeY domain-containing protein [Candidatus Omnitrophota bacterium]